MFYSSKVGKIHYDVKGPKGAPTVVFTHGGGLNGEMFNQQVIHLKNNYRTITWDLQGHGRSARLKENLDVPMMADCLAGIMDEVGVKKAVLVGQSLGVFVNLHAALRYPLRIKANVTIGGMPLEKPMSRLELLAFRVLMHISRLLPERTIFERAAREKAITEEAQQFFLESMNSMGKDQFLKMLGGQLDACEIKVSSPPRQPLLITHGEHEMPKSLVKANRQWHKTVPGSRYFEIPKAGHNANMDNPEAFNRELENFLSGIWNGKETIAI